MKLRKAKLLDSSCKNQAWWCVPATLGLEERNGELPGGWGPSSTTKSVSSRFTESPFPKYKVVFEEDICLPLLASTCVYEVPLHSVPCPYTHVLSIYKKMDKINESTWQHYEIKTHGFMSSLGQLHSIRKHVSTVSYTHTTCDHYSTLLGSGHVPSHSVPTAAL